MDHSTNGAGKSGAHPMDRYSAAPAAPGGQQNDSPFYKSSAPAISLPKGGGALKGIDEKFSVNAVNGSGNLSIALPLSLGRGGFTPALSLSYSAGAGNGPFGLGWSLSLPAIQRRTDKQLPRYADSLHSDTFLLAGAEDLVPELDAAGNPLLVQSGIYSILRYLPRTEGSFARIEHISRQDTPGSWWRITGRDNTCTWYGTDASSRIADPADDSRIFCWLPRLATDHKGNVQLFDYVAENNTGAAGLHEEHRLSGLAACTNRYLKRIQYCNEQPFFPAGPGYEPAWPSVDFLMEAVFDYGDHSSPHDPRPDLPWPHRGDAFSDYRAGFELRTRRLCRRVLMFHHFDELLGYDLVRSLSLTYRQDSLPSGSRSEADYIVSAVQAGHEYASGAWRQRSLPAMSFSYEPLQWGRQWQSPSPAGLSGAPQGLTGPYLWTDLEGEGISGILSEQGGGWFYKDNLGNGHFGPARCIGQKPSFAGLGSSLQWQDLEADGNRQLVSRDAANGYWEQHHDGSWAPFRAFVHHLNIDWDSPFTKMLDLDGDGKPEVLLSDDRVWTWYHNEGRQGFGAGGSVIPARDEEKGPVLLLRDDIQSIFLADMSGDGLTDLVRVKNGELCYWPNMGYGRFGAKVAMSDAPWFHDAQFNPVYLSLADVSGTGAADVIYTGAGRCSVWLNQAGNGFAAREDIAAVPGTDAWSKLAVLDFLGNGTGCLVWSSPLPQHSSSPLRYIDLMAGKKPYLLSGYSNGMGKTVTLLYKSSTQYYLEDKRAGDPWATKLPFPVHCLSGIRTEDTVSGTVYSQSYRYRHGYYDHAEREFRGFGYVETLDADTVASADAHGLDQPTVLTKTWYHTGAWVRQGLLEAAYRQQYYPLQGWEEHGLRHDLPSGLSSRELRQAHRALKGQLLRREVYSPDGSPQQHIPYSVTAGYYTVSRLQAAGRNPYAVFQCLPQQNLSWQCEREPGQARLNQELVLETDSYGHVLQSAQVVYGRQNAPDVSITYPQRVYDEQQRMHIVCSQTSYSNDVCTDLHYRLRVPWQQSTYELNGYTAPGQIAGPGGPLQRLWTVVDLLSFINSAAETGFADSTGNSASKRLLERSLQLFATDDGSQALPAGTLHLQALPWESYRLAYDDSSLKAFEGRVDGNMLTEGGFVTLMDEDRYWLPSGRSLYENPAECFYTPRAYLDPWGYETQVSFGGEDNSHNYWLMPYSVTDALGNENAVTLYDWRTLQPLRMRDANGNYSEIRYDTLGLPVAMAVLGKDNGMEGDSLSGLQLYNEGDLIKQFFDDPQGQAAVVLQDATWRCVYDLRQSPVVVAMIARQGHVHDPLLAKVQKDELIIRLTYSDSFSRVIMHKANCEPDDYGRSWVGSGRTIYNNKGKAVMQFEPYFSDSHHCDTAEQAAGDGVSARMFYDPLDRLQRTEQPDGTVSSISWDPWKQTIWDAGDSVAGSDWYNERLYGALGAVPEEYDAAQQSLAYADTPTLMHSDSLGRVICTVQQDSANTWILSHTELDIQGNPLRLQDGNGLQCLSRVYNMLQQPCRQQSADSGVQYTLTDVAGQPLYGWDADDRRHYMVYDACRRITEQWCDGLLLEKSVYGEAVGNAEMLNLRGQLWEHYDGSGMQYMPEGYDFKGQPLKVSQRLLLDKAARDVSWDIAQELELDAYESYSRTDALGRPVQSVDAGGHVRKFIYDRGGSLTKVLLGDTEYVKSIRYDAKGQRQSIVYGNDTVTRYTYDPLSYRLRRLLTTAGYGQRILQDLNYYYDAAGNITKVRDDAQQAEFFGNTIISPEQAFRYDPLYRLVRAEGREQNGLSSFGDMDNYRDDAWRQPHPGNGDRTHRYVQYYEYDAVGNILQLRHVVAADTSYSFKRDYSYDDDSNRLLHTQAGDAAVYSYSHDTRGNMTAMPHLQSMGYNVSNELDYLQRGYQEAYYQYSGGQRLRKWVDTGSLQEERIYMGGFEIYRKFEGSSLKVERQTVHISDDIGRIAMLEMRTYGEASSDNDTEQVLTRYVYSNHLQSAGLELDESGSIISYEEYRPYGTTAYQAMNADIRASAKRYRYTGKERDEESGLYYHGARYYIPWLCRWSAVDPLESERPGLSPYDYCSNNPVNRVDPDGMKDGDPKTQGQPMQLNLSPTASGMYEVPTIDGNSVYQRPQGTAGFSQLNPIVLDEVQPEPAFQSSDKIGIDFYYYRGRLGWVNSGIGIGSPYSPEAIKASGLMTKAEAIAFDIKSDANLKMEQHQAIVEENREGAEMYMRMRNPAFMAAYTAYQFNPASLAVGAYNSFSEGNNKTGLAQLTLLAIPVVGKVASAEIKAISNIAKEETILLRHYTSNKGFGGIQVDMEIKAFDQNTVFAEKASGKPLSAAAAAEKYGISKGSARNYIEFEVPKKDVEIIKNPITKAKEYTVKGNVKLDPQTTKFFKRN